MKKRQKEKRTQRPSKSSLVQLERLNYIISRSKMQM